MNKVKHFLLTLLWESSGTAFLCFAIMLALSIFNLINSTMLSYTNAWMLLFIPLAFLPPAVIFAASRGGKEYVPTVHLSFPKKHHVPTLIYSTVLMILGSLLLKITFFEGKYTDFSLYGAFFAHRNGNLWNDIYLLLAFCIVPPIFEGLIFRGVFIREHDRRGRLTCSVISALFFALLGFNLQEIPQRFFLGILLCMILYATDSIAVTVAMHIIYNAFAVFIEPIFISLKTVSSQTELFINILAIFTVISAIFLFSHLSRLYGKYSRDENYNNFTKSTPKNRTFWHLVELLTSIPAVACYVIFIAVTLISTI